jgi:hypothetical protein
MNADTTKETEALLGIELEQIQGGACNCDSGAGQIVIRPNEHNRL